MNLMKNIALLMILLVFASSCKKEIDNLSELDKVTAPTNVTAVFDITQDNSGLVTIVPAAEGVTSYSITFGDVADEVPEVYSVHEKITHTYTEGVYSVGITAIGLSGLTATINKELNVTFKAPEDLDVTIEIDDTNPALVFVSATAKYATVMDIYFGDVPDEEPVQALPEEVVSHLYDEPGDFIIKVVAKSGGAETTEFTDTVTIVGATDPITFPVTFESITVNYAFNDFGNVVTTVVDNPDPSGINTSSKVAKSIKPDGAETWGGSFFTMESPIDFLASQKLKLKVWSPKSNAVVKLKVENKDNTDLNYEVDMTTTVSNQWEEITYDFTGIDLSYEYQNIVVFFDFGNVGDNSEYYFDDVDLVNTTPGTGITGTWKMEPVAGSLGVGPEQGDISWWAIDDAGIVERACFFDDTYVFNADGTFNNVLDGETWVEDWQGGTNSCGAPVAPHDGLNPGTFVYDGTAGSVTLNGIGSYLGIPKAYNGGELTTPDDTPETITYVVALTENDTKMTLDIDVGGGWWRFILVKDESPVSSVLEGTWKIAPEASSLGVGPEMGDMSWWAIADAGVAERACFFDDTYVFGADGSFTNILGSETWVEDWQGGTNSCGIPVTPHDGTNPATYTYDASAGTVTIVGLGSYLGIPKPYNGGELTSPADAPDSITYLISLSENNTRMTIDIDIATGWWRFILVKN